MLLSYAWPCLIVDESEDDSASCQHCWLRIMMQLPPQAAGQQLAAGQKVYRLVCGICACLVFVPVCDEQPYWLFVAVITQEQSNACFNPNHRRWGLHVACQASCILQQGTYFNIVCICYMPELPDLSGHIAYPYTQMSLL